MGMSSSPAPPPAPDPMATAQAQATMNKETAVAQTGLNAMNQYGPDGSIEYAQNGTWADGTPRFFQTTNLSGANQNIFNTNKATEQNIANIGREQSSRIGDLLGKPMALGNEATEARLMDLGMKRLDPQFARDEESLRTRLANSGIRAGSAAFDAEMQRLGQTRNDAVNQLLLTGRNQANQEILAERNQPINEITALMSGSQVSNPTFANTPQTPVAGVDYTGLVRDNYNAQMQQYNSKVGQQNAMMGGLFGLAGTLGKAAFMFSDRRLKKDIEDTGRDVNGFNVYRYRYKGESSDQPKHTGVMAQEVEKKMPHAVVVDAITNRKMVNYSEVLQ